MNYGNILVVRSLEPVVYCSTWCLKMQKACANFILSDDDDDDNNNNSNSNNP